MEVYEIYAVSGIIIVFGLVLTAGLMIKARKQYQQMKSKCTSQIENILMGTYNPNTETEDNNEGSSDATQSNNRERLETEDFTEEATDW